MYRWCKFTNTEHEQRASHLGYRAMLEALDDLIKTSYTHDDKFSKNKMVKLKRRGLTKLQMTSYESFKEHALKRFDFGLEKEDIVKLDLAAKLDLLHEQHQGQFILFEYIVGLQSFLQEILERFVTLDRLFYLQEQGFNPKACTIFDEDVSPRNTVIYCFK